MEFLQLARWNSDWTFLIYGPEGNIPLKLVQKAGGIPPNVKQLGELKRGKDHNLAFGNASKFFMFVKCEEAFGRVVAEATSKGTPVLASNWGSLPEIILGHDGKGKGVGSVSATLQQLNASYGKDYNYDRVYQYAKANFVECECVSQVCSALALVQPN